MCRIHLAVVVACAVVFCFVCSSLVSAEESVEDTIWIRENEQDYEVTLDVPASTMVAYADNQNCGTAGHKTRLGNRFYVHVHITYNLPLGGTDQNGNDRWVTTSGIDGYWNASPASPYKSGYTHTSAADQWKWNCYSYALEYDKTNWVQHAHWVLDDDYTAGSPVQDTAVEACYAEVYAHARKIVETDWFTSTQSYCVTKTREKNGPSDIYTRTYGYFASYSSPKEYMTFYRKDF